MAAIRRNLQDRYDWEAWRSGRSQGLRIQDAWTFDRNVKHIAVNAHVLDLLSRLYGKPAFPFQTLNFPVGTEQHFHTDSIHFSSIPERFMCGVWVAFEDVSPEAGPLIYYPGSHRLPIYLNEQLGAVPRHGADPYGTYPAFVDFWRQLVSAQNLRPIEFLPRKGQAVIWAANLLHGGAAYQTRDRTRWSQVTHYYFRGCAFYTPLGSLPYLGSIEYRDVIDISTGETVQPEINGVLLTTEMRRQLARKPLASNAALPPDFDDAAYLALHPDVVAAGLNPREHYLQYGSREGRAYRLPRAAHAAPGARSGILDSITALFRRT